MLEAGIKIKDFTLLDQDGKEFVLSENLGKKMVIYFYPKDDTPGCTKQACSFRDNINQFKDRDVTVIGISKDSVESHQKFIEGYHLPFRLLSDPDMKVIKYFGAWGEKTSYGVKKMGIIRSTFILDENGIIEKVYKKAVPDKNAGQIIDYLDSKK